MVILDHKLTFPHPCNTQGFEPLAIGGDLSIERLLLAYSNGIFPWQDNPLVWYSPDPRGVLFLHDFKLTKSLQKSIRNKGFVIKIDTNFELVMRNCQQIKRANESGTWISDYFIQSYTNLFHEGFAHSFEIYLDSVLVGGLYGISLGGVFMGESMFAKVSDASKVAFFYLVQFCIAHNFHFIDAQVQNPHLQSLGVKEISKKKYLKLLESALSMKTLRGNWSNYFYNN